MRDEMIPEDDQGVAEEIWQTQRVTEEDEHGQCVCIPVHALRVVATAMGGRVTSAVLQEQTGSIWKDIRQLEIAETGSIILYSPKSCNNPSEIIQETPDMTEWPKEQE